MKKVWITAYDMVSAMIAEEAKVDAILVGDSLGMTVYGFENTTKVTKELMRQHFEVVQHFAPHTRIIVDMPFGADASLLTFLETLEYFAEAGAKEYKVELTEENFSCLLEARSRGYNMVAHLGYLPQSMHTPKVVGKEEEDSAKIIRLARMADTLGVSALVLECVPEILAQTITELVSCEVIGIGAGRYVSGQILVFDDIIGKTQSSFTPKFLRRFGNAFEENKKSVFAFAESVQSETFPGEKEIY